MLSIGTANLSVERKEPTRYVTPVTDKEQGMDGQENSDYQEDDRTDPPEGFSKILARLGCAGSVSGTGDSDRDGG